MATVVGGLWAAFKYRRKPRCSGCGVPLDTQNDSRAHIIPNALGGRLAPKGIICRSCNTTLGNVADNALIDAFGVWPTLLDIPRQQGQNPTKTIDTRNGHRVRVKADGSSTKVDVQYDVAVIPEGHSIQISAGDMKTIRQLLLKAAKEFPQFDPTMAEGHARTIQDQGDQFKLNLDFSPQAVFGGVSTAIWLYLFLKTNRSFMDWKSLLAYITNAQNQGGQLRYFVEGLPGLRGPQIDLGHKLIVRSVPATGELIAYVEILGILKVGGIFAKSPRPGFALEHIYVHDVRQETDRSNEFSIDGAEFDRQDWKTVGLSPADAIALRAHFRKALEIFIHYYQQRFRATPSA
ncbi:MAG: HNH endonuclease [Burkholderiales bacterium]|nr:HNH endonuclease [Burkholderiales bacterium]